MAVYMDVSPKIYRCVESASIVESPLATSSLLASRVAALAPLEAVRISEKIKELGPTVVSDCLTSDLALQQRVDAELGRLRREETVVLPRASVRAVSPLVAHRSLRAVSPLPTVRAVSPLPAVRAVSPLPSTTIVSSPLGTRHYVVPGLSDYLVDLGLSQYSVVASDWAVSRGYYLSDIVSNQVVFADALGLRPLERARLLREGPVVAARYLPREVILA